MLPNKKDVSAHSILGSVSDFYQHQALENVDKENDDVTLTLPPIFKNKSKEIVENNDDTSIQKSLDNPTIPSLFSPMTKNAKYRRQSNLKDLIRGQKIEKNKENRKLQQLLKGDRIYATREERVLKRWEQQQRKWKSMKKNIAQKIGKKEDELVITRAEEWRETIEEIDLLTKSIPSASMSSNHWQHSLRKKTGDEETTHLVPIGNMFSGLYCKVTHNPKKPMKESVRKPRPFMVNNINDNDDIIVPKHYNLPGTGGASKHWRERSVSYQFRKKLHKKMKQLKPNNLDELDGLEIVGYNMFNIDKVPLPAYSYERLANTKYNNDMKMNKYESKNNSEIDDESYQFVEYENVPIIGPSIQFIPKNIILFNSSLYEEQTKVLEIKNVGTTAMLIRFENVEQIFKKNAIFLYPTEQFSILPGDTKYIGFYFKPSKPGSYHLVIGIESFPCISPKYIELQGICKIEDEDKIHRDQFVKQMINDQIEQDVTKIVNNMIQSIPEPDIEINNLPKLFCQRNRDHKLYWYSEILDKLQILSSTIISKFRRRKRNSYKWDLSVSTLKIWLKELENIQSESVIQSLSDELSEHIEFAQKIPPPNSLYYDLCSTLINDLALQIPRFSWRANEFAKISHKNDEQQENEKKDEINIENNESDTSSIVEWNVFESEYYKSQLYEHCNEYLCHIINQFENSIINDNEIDESVIKPIQSKLNPKPHKIVTFGSWVFNESKLQSNETDENEEDTTNIIKCIEIEPLYNYCIESIHCNSKITIMSSLYQTHMCPNKQSFKIIEELNNTSSEHKEIEIKDNENEDENEDKEEKEFATLNEFKLLPIFKGFNIVQIFCCDDMINILTDTGDVYCSLVDDLESHQTEVLYNKNIIKIYGSQTTNKCVALSESGEIFEWSLISDICENSETNEEKNEKLKDTNVENSESTDNENKEKVSKMYKISEAKQLIEIEDKIKDIAITTSAYAAITENNKLIIFGDFSKIYSKAENQNSKNTKTKKKSKQKKEEKVNDEENKQSVQPYTVIEIKKPNTNEEEDEAMNVKYKSIISCLNSFIVLEENGNLYSFGNDEYGTLGLGDQIKESLQPQLIQFDNKSDVQINSISSWINGCVAIDNKSNIYYWGKWFETETEIIPQTEDNKEQKPKQQTVFYVPTKVELQSENNQTRKVAITNVGGFVWC